MRTTLSKTVSCFRILWEHWPSGINLEKNWGILRNDQITLIISEDTLGQAHLQKSCQQVPILQQIYLKSKVNIDGWLILVPNLVWEQGMREERSKIHGLAFNQSFYWKTLSGLKGTHTQRLTSSFNLKVWCNFTLKPCIKTALRQHRKSPLDHHNIKLSLLNIFCFCFF